MKFNLYRQFGALNSKAVFDAFSQGIKKLGYSESQEPTAIPVIWSVLWAGRMLGNQKIYEQAVSKNLPVIIVEVGNLKRNITWRISVDHVNSQGYFGNEQNLDSTRVTHFQSLTPVNNNRNNAVLITTQRHESLQWQGLPLVEKWVDQTVANIKKYTDRSIVVRSHPRSRSMPASESYTVDPPKKIIGSYDDYNINYNYHCVISHNSGTAVQAAINGTPIICHSTSLASPVSDVWQNLENVKLPNRNDWYLRLCHTEWAVDEIAKGVPLMRLVPYLQQRLKSTG